MFLLAFRILTTEDVTWGDVFPGALVAASSWTALQALGGYIVSQWSFAYGGRLPTPSSR
jgi:uncharacterized BrkB/YihY/UPF0761 family membrane protein